MFNRFPLPKVWLTSIIFFLSSCVMVSPATIKERYVEIPCELPSGVPSTCRVAQWQNSPDLYWEHGNWHPFIWSWLWHPHYWLFNQPQRINGTKS